AWAGLPRLSRWPPLPAGDEVATCGLVDPGAAAAMILVRAAQMRCQGIVLLEGDAEVRDVVPRDEIGSAARGAPDEEAPTITPSVGRVDAPAAHHRGRREDRESVVEGEGTVGQELAGIPPITDDR